MSLRRPCLKCLVRVTCTKQSQCYDLHVYIDAWKTLSRLCWGLFAVVSVLLVIIQSVAPIMMVLIMMPIAALACWVELKHSMIDLNITMGYDGFPPTRKFY